MKTIILLLISITLTLAVNSCKPDDKADMEWPIPQELLDYFSFKTSSMWVYENDKTGDKDTITITDNTLVWSNWQEGERFQQANVYYKSSLDGYTYRYYSNTFGSSNCIKMKGSGSPCYSLHCSKYKPGNYIGENVMFQFFFKLNNWGFADNRGSTSKFEIKEIHDSLTIAGTLYKSVAKVFISDCFTQEDKDMNFYWTKDYGIARKENITDNETWNLIYSNIVK